MVRSDAVAWVAGVGGRVVSAPADVSTYEVYDAGAIDEAPRGGPGIPVGDPGGHQQRPRVSSRRDAGTGRVWNPRFGWGRLDAAALLGG